MSMDSKRKGLYYLILSIQAVLFLISYPTAGLCGTLIKDQSITHDGMVRTYHLYVPDELPESSLPLLFILHGGHSNANEIIGLPGNAAPSKVFLDLADINKFIAVIPNGVAVDPNDPEARHWNDCRGDCTINGDADDVGFIDALINAVATEYAIDLERVYCQGVSNGGFMCFRLARELSHKIAAVAPALAAAAKNNLCQPPSPDNPISIMMINGTDDPLLPWDGGQVGGELDFTRGTSESVPDTIAFWAAHNGTERKDKVFNFPDIDKKDESTVRKKTYGNGREGTEVILYQVKGGGHAQPSIQEKYSRLYELLVVGRQNHDIETAVEAWTFLQKHSLNGPTVSEAGDSMHVDALNLSTSGGDKGAKKGKATVTVKDNLGNPVFAAQVSGHFSGGFNETVTVDTDSDGIAVLETGGTMKGKISYEFCVIGIIHTGLSYKQDENTITCDSY